MEYGGVIERGRAMECTAGGWIVESLDRPGIVSPPLPALSDGLCAAGDVVLFVLFADGTGMVLCAAQAE